MRAALDIFRIPQLLERFQQYKNRLDSLESAARADRELCELLGAEALDPWTGFNCGPEFVNEGVVGASMYKMLASAGEVAGELAASTVREANEVLLNVVTLELHRLLRLVGALAARMLQLLASGASLVEVLSVAQVFFCHAPSHQQELVKQLRSTRFRTDA